MTEQKDEEAMEENQRPSYSDIVLAYLREGYRAWQARDGASAAGVERELGLSFDEGIQAATLVLARGFRRRWPPGHRFKQCLGLPSAHQSG